MSLVIVLNGLLCHITNMRALVFWDVLWNAVFITYVNLFTSWQPHTAVVTAISAFAFVQSSPFPNSFRWSVVHVVFVQWLLLVALWHFGAPPVSTALGRQNVNVSGHFA